MFIERLVYDARTRRIESGRFGDELFSGAVLAPDKIAHGDRAYVAAILDEVVATARVRAPVDDVARLVIEGARGGQRVFLDDIAVPAGTSADEAALAARLADVVDVVYALVVIE